MKLHCMFPVPVVRGACDTTATDACLSAYTTGLQSLVDSGSVLTGLCRYSSLFIIHTAD